MTPFYYLLFYFEERVGKAKWLEHAFIASSKTGLSIAFIQAPFYLFSPWLTNIYSKPCQTSKMEHYSEYMWFVCWWQEVQGLQVFSFCTVNINDEHTKPTISFIIFLDYLMFCQIFLSPQVKRWSIITYKHGIYELPHELPNDLRLNILGN